jgi:hypothetical protein
VDGEPKPEEQRQRDEEEARVFWGYGRVGSVHEEEWRKCVRRWRTWKRPVSLRNVEEVKEAWREEDVP